MVATQFSCIINIDEKLNAGEHWELTSDDLPGFYLGGKDLAALRNDIPEAIKLLFRTNYEMEVDVSIKPRLRSDENVRN